VVLTHELCLHVSHGCLHEDVEKLDPLFFRTLNAGIDDGEHLPVSIGPLDAGNRSATTVSI
jgi:hypothetical protein